jgi:hypothetical protein
MRESNDKKRCYGGIDSRAYKTFTNMGSDLDPG